MCVCPTGPYTDSIVLKVGQPCRPQWPSDKYRKCTRISLGHFPGYFANRPWGERVPLKGPMCSFQEVKASTTKPLDSTLNASNDTSISALGAGCSRGWKRKSQVWKFRGSGIEKAVAKTKGSNREEFFMY